MTKIEQAKIKLPILYKKIADLTLNEGCKKCHIPLSCCSLEYCEFSRNYAKEVWNVELKETQPNLNKKNLLFMSETGCIVPPHLRPACALHCCQINSLGFFPKNEKATKEYFELRTKIEHAEARLLGYL